MKKAVCLLSGGLDSSTAIAIAKEEGFALYALSFLYGQRHLFELEAAKKIAAATGVEEHRICEINLALFGGSALTDSNISVPKSRSLEEMDSGIPVTYVPARNTIFLSFALAYAEVIGARDIFIGVNALDYSGYPDCRPEYIAAYEKMANLGTRDNEEPFKIHTPLIQLTKGQIISEGIRLGVDYSVTHTCYDPVGDEGKACGQCDACLLRLKGFNENLIPDPAPYAEV